MKKIITLVIPAVILFSTAVNAQFGKGDVLLGGTINFSTQVRPESGDNTQYIGNSFGIGPSVGFFLNDKFAVGALVGYSSSKSEFGISPNKNVQTEIGINAGVFGRRYFTISEKFFFTLHGSLSFGRDTFKYESDDGASYGHDESYTLRAALAPLLIFMPSPNWGFEGGIGTLSYSHTQSLLDNSSSNSFQLSAGNINFGVAYYFRKATK